MKQVKQVLVILGLILVVNSAWTAAITPEKLMDQVDQYRHLESAEMEARMVIIKGGRKLIKKMDSWVKGADKSLTEFTNSRDQGTKFLKRGDSLYMSFPDAEGITKVSGHMMEEGMMGSDFSYQDMMESTELKELYQFKILREEELDGRPCYVVEGTKQEGADASYYRRVSWVDKQRYVLLQEKLYARSGRLLKEMKTTKVEKIDDRWFATAQVMKDKLQRNTKTEFIIDSIEFNVQFEADKFSLSELRD